QAVDQFAKIAEEDLAGNPLYEGVRQRLLETALSYYQNFLDQRRDDPTIRAELEASRAKVATILGELTTLMGMGQYAVLQQKSVQEELGLSEDQRAALAEIDKNWHKFVHEFGGRGPWEERERRRLALARNQEEVVAKLLDPGQLRRFKQIAL